MAVKTWDEVFGSATPTPSKATGRNKNGIKAWDEVFSNKTEPLPDPSTAAKNIVKTLFPILPAISTVKNSLQFKGRDNNLLPEPANPVKSRGASASWGSDEEIANTIAEHQKLPGYNELLATEKDDLLGYEKWKDETLEASRHSITPWFALDTSPEAYLAAKQGSATAPQIERLEQMDKDYQAAPWDYNENYRKTVGTELKKNVGKVGSLGYSFAQGASGNTLPEAKDVYGRDTTRGEEAARSIGKLLPTFQNIRASYTDEPTGFEKAGAPYLYSATRGISAGLLPEYEQVFKEEQPLGAKALEIGGEVVPMIMTEGAVNKLIPSLSRANEARAVAEGLPKLARGIKVGRGAATGAVYMGGTAALKGEDPLTAAVKGAVTWPLAEGAFGLAIKGGNKVLKLPGYIANRVKSKFGPGATVEQIKTVVDEAVKAGKINTEDAAVIYDQFGKTNKLPQGDNLLPDIKAGKYTPTAQQEAQIQFNKYLEGLRSVIEARAKKPTINTETEQVNLIYDFFEGKVGKNEIRRMTRAEKESLSSEILANWKQPNLWNIAKEEAQKRGINLDELQKMATNSQYAEQAVTAGVLRTPRQRLPEDFQAAGLELPKVKAKNPEYSNLEELQSQAAQGSYQLGGQSQQKPAAGNLLPEGVGARTTTAEKLLPDIQKQVGKRVDSLTEPATLPAGLSVKVVNSKIPTPTEGFKFSDPKIESRWKSSQGIKPESLGGRVRQGLVEFKNRATREYELLPKNKEFAQLRFDLKKLEKQKEVSKDTAARLLQGITVNLDKEGYNLFSRKVILDDLAQDAAKGRELPFGFTAESLAKEKALVDRAAETNQVIKDAVAQRKQVQDAIKTDYANVMKDIGFDVSDRLSNEDYFHHQVLEYANAKGLAGTGSKLKTPTNRGFLRKRGGSSFDINTDYLQAESEVTAQMLHDIEVARTIKDIDSHYNIAGELMAQAKREGVSDWRELIPEGYTTWQPREGNMFYMADSVPAQMAEKLYSDSLAELGIKAEDLSKALAKGQKYKEFVVKDEIAKTLDSLKKTAKENVVTKASSEVMRGWKVWTLLNPRRLLKYNIRNLSGDADAVFVGNPSTFKKVPQAIQELFQVFKANRSMTPEMREFFNRGGMQSTLQFQELKDINNLDIFKNLFEKTSNFNVWKKYWNAARLSTDFREAILRYASYLDYMEQMAKNSGKPNNFGASIPEEIMGLKDIRDRAFWLSNDLLGAYDRVSVLGQDIRKHVIPFYSWMEVNFTRYSRFARNAARDEKLAETAGKKLVGAITRSPVIAYNIGKFAVKASAFWATLQAYNQLRYPEEEKDLPPDIQAKPHIILGRTEDGQVRYFDRLGALGDFLEWFGLDSPTKDVKDFLDGKRTIKEIAVDMAKSPLNKVINAATPVWKTPAEITTGKKLFPDAFKPSTIRDPADYIAQSLGMENEFRALTGRPSKPYKESLTGLVEYRSDPDQSAYYYILDEKQRFLKKIGKGGEGSFSSPRSEALRNVKTAIRYKDKEAARKYLIEYVNLGGTDKGLIQSLSSMSPLYGLSKDEQIAFVESLNKEDREQMKKALKFYVETFAPK